jgi:hypothetical protein
MTRKVPPLTPEVHAILERVRIVAPLPHVVRTRALARARAAMGTTRGERARPLARQG